MEPGDAAGLTQGPRECGRAAASAGKGAQVRRGCGSPVPYVSVDGCLSPEGGRPPSQMVTTCGATACQTRSATVVSSASASMTQKRS
jgi:hypothetical protein